MGKLSVGVKPMKKAWKPYGVDVEIKAPGIKKTILWGNKVGGQLTELK